MDCRTCRFNSYIGKSDGWVTCNHPRTIAKAVHWEQGDPAWVNMLTADRQIEDMELLQDCPTYEPAKTTVNA